MKTRMPYDEALALAEEVKAVLAPGSERIEIAGSLRRKKTEIGDLELIVIPKTEEITDMFGMPNGVKSVLDEIIAGKYRVIKGDKKYKQLDLGLITCDLFIQPDPETWGVNMLIRTGCAEFSHWFVTERRKGGAMPGYMYIADARLWCSTKKISTPEEVDVFKEVGVKWISPEDRVQGFWNQLGGLIYQPSGALQNR